MPPSTKDTYTKAYSFPYIYDVIYRVKKDGV